MIVELKKLKERRSVRSFLPEGLSSEVKNKLLAEATFINSHVAGLNFQLSFGDDDPMRGFSRSYGMFSNARNYLAAVVDPSFEGAIEKAGYYGEQFVMKALEWGIGCCFISGSYSPAHVAARMEVYEKLPFIIVFGYPGGNETFMGRTIRKLVHGKERKARDFFAGSDGEYHEALRQYEWLPVGLEGLACAPSASNRQPVRIYLEMEEGELLLKAKLVGRGTKIDLGIGKFNFEAPLPVEGEWDGDTFRILE